MKDILEHARWISCGEKEHPRDYAPIFRKTFTAEGPFSSARLYLCGLGYHFAAINGLPVTDILFEPAFTNYNKRIYVSEYEVGRLLNPGANVLSVELGRGFYAMNVVNVWGHERETWHDEPKLICRLDIEYRDGKTASIESDESFVSTIGPTTR